MVGRRRRVYQPRMGQFCEGCRRFKREWAFVEGGWLPGRGWCCAICVERERGR